MTHPPRRRPAGLYMYKLSAHPSHPHKHPLASSGYSNLKGQRIARQLVSRTTSPPPPPPPFPAPSAPRARRPKNARPAAANQGLALDDEDDPFMATVFLQFCPTCERQIMIPSDSILYCSESCRRKDSYTPLDLPQATVHKMTSSKKSPPASPPFTPKASVAPRAPSQPASCSTSPVRIPLNNHEETPSKLDLPPWKPKRKHKATDAIASTEAFRYLSRFQTTNPPSSVTSNDSNTTSRQSADGNPTHHGNNNNNSTTTTTNNNNDDNDTIPPRPVPIALHSSTSISTTSGHSTTQVPSLAHSPTTSAASSLLDSPTEPMAAYMPTAITTTHALPQPATHHQRVSLPPRYNAGSDMHSNRSFELAMPYIVVDPNDDATGPTTVENERKTVAAGAVGNGGDGCFLRHRQENIGRGKLVEHSASSSTASSSSSISAFAVGEHGNGHGQRGFNCEN
ncbi:hypothetical protein GX51_07810 [Blastomyces parvus]|uniref:Uncharacterized protein n=1 Tax=Blastomyces parvus TaxID=2060905 RepID=A0A2B7WIL7_9EURO|nr:hypothetical protein GX51_07810 [Blastomyces parvus]